MGIFDQIKNAFSKTDEEPVKADVAAAPPAEPEPAEPQPPEAEVRTYTVKSGDTLWKIAEDVYGDGNEYQKIFEANQAILESPDHILPGQELIIP